MSATMRTLAIRDSRIDIDSGDPLHIVDEGPANVTYQRVLSQSNNSTSSTTYLITPPSPNVGLSRYVLQQVSGYITLTGAQLGACAFAIRPWAIASNTSSVQVQLNTSNITYSQQNQWINAYSRVSNPYSSQQTYQSGSPCSPDVFNNYLDMPLTTQISPFISGAAIRPGDGYAQSRVAAITSINFYNTDGSDATAAAATGATIFFTITEPIVCGPFVSDTDQTCALFGLNQVNITYTWANQLSKILSVRVPTGGPTINSSVTTFTSQQLLISYVTPSEMSLVSRPIAANYNCPDIRLYTTAFGGTVATNSYTASAIGGATVYSYSNITQQVTLNSITLPKCPRLLLIWATRPQNDLNALPTAGGGNNGAMALVDAFLPISNLSIQCYDKAALLAGASAEQLYSMSLSAGLKATLAQFLGSAVFDGSSTAVLPAAGAGVKTQYSAPVGAYSAAPMVIDFSNLSLPAGIAPGSNAQTQFQATFNIANNYIATTANGGATALASGAQLNMLVITDGYLTVAGGASEWVIGGLEAKDVEEAKLATPFQSAEISKARSSATLTGGSFWDTLKGIGKMALPMLGMIQPELAPLTAAGSAMLGSGLKKAPSRKQGYY